MKYQDILQQFNERVKANNYFIEPTEKMLRFVRRKRYLHIRAQRCASTSIHEVLGGDSRHIGAKKFKDLLGYGWPAIFKFSICRNPYTRFVSSYNAFGKDERDINEYLEVEGMERLMRVRFFSFLPQHVFFYDNDELILDYLGKYEELDKAWKHISHEIGINEQLPHIGKTWEVELTDKSKEMIYPFYQKDFELLGYEGG